MATNQFNVVRSILNKTVFDENVIHMILMEYWKDLKNKRKVLLDWIKPEQLSWHSLSNNPNAMELLKERVEYEDSLTIDEYINLSDKIDWEYFSKICDDMYILEEHLFQLDSGSIGINLNAIEYIKKYIHKADWDALSSNPNAIDLLKENKDKICWDQLSLNPNAMDLLKQNKGKINWVGLSCNKNAIDLLEQYKSNIDWKFISLNPNAIDLIRKRIKYENKFMTPYVYNNIKNKIDWSFLSTNPSAIDILKNNPDKIDWCELSTNPNAIDLLKNNKDKIDWKSLAENPSIFEDEPMPL
jgi:hypothetical protein